MSWLLLVPAALVAGALIAAMGVAIVHLLSKGTAEPITPTKRRVDQATEDLGVREDD